MKLSKSRPLIPTQIEWRRKTVARGWKHFTQWLGVLGWDLPCFILTELCRWHDVYGWHLPPLNEEEFPGLHLFYERREAFGWSEVVEKISPPGQKSH
jgi:hypothetical protein